MGVKRFQWKEKSNLNALYMINIIYIPAEVSPGWRTEAPEK